MRPGEPDPTPAPPLFDEHLNEPYGSTISCWTTPLLKDNCWLRHFAPQLQAAGLGWVNFQVMRRTHSCLMKDLDIDPQIRAEQMGHTVDVNQNVYTRTSIARRREAVNRLEVSLRVN